VGILSLLTGIASACKSFTHTLFFSFSHVVIVKKLHICATKYCCTCFVLEKFYEKLGIVFRALFCLKYHNCEKLRAFILAAFASAVQ
jgi:hypothetical protein